MPVCWRYLRLAISVSPGPISLLCLIVAIVIFTCMSSLERRENTCLYVEQKQLENHTHFEQFKVLLRGRVLKQTEENEYSYCFCSQQDLDFFQWLLSKQNTDEIAQSSHVSTEGVSAHHRLLRPDDTVQDNNGSPSYTFLNLSAVKQADTEHATHVEVRDSGYHILHSGLYHIYSSLSPFNVTDSLCGQLDNQTWKQSVLLFRPGDRLRSGVLMTGVHSCCIQCPIDTTNSFVGGVFPLSAGDVLSVQVSDSRLLLPKTDPSFFGLRRL